MSKINFEVSTEEDSKSEAFMSKKKFSAMVETLVKESGLHYIDCIVHICEKNNLEIEDCKKYLSLPILSRIEGEAQALNFLPRQNTLEQFTK